MKLNTEKYILFAIVLAAAILRFYKLAAIPNGFYVDEAAQGYNAYSIALTLRDEYGKILPVFLKSFGAYSSPLYVFATAIVIKFFGLSVLTTRFLSALSGILTIVFVYLIAKKIELFSTKNIPLISAFLFAISPWSIFFSRGAFEANFALMLLSAGIYFLIISRNNTKLLYLAVISLALSVYAYQAERLIVVILFPVFIFINREKYKLKKNFKTLVAASILGVAVSLPQLFILRSPAFALRASGLFYSDAIAARTMPWVLSFIKEFSAQFITYFSPRSLFYLPDPDPQRSLPGLSNFYLWMMPFYLLGMYMLFKSRNIFSKKITILLLIAFAVPPALTRDPFSSLRSLQLVLPLVFIISLGLANLLAKLKLKTKIVFWTIAISISFVSLWRSEFVLLPYLRAADWGFGYEQLAEQIKSSDSKFIIDTGRIKPPHILLAFYLKYPPKEFQKLKPDILPNYYTDTKFDAHYNFANIETRPVDWQNDIFKDQILIGDEWAISEDQANEHFLTKQFEIRDSLNELVFVGYKTNPAAKCASIGNDNLNCVY